MRTLLLCCLVAASFAPPAAAVAEAPAGNRVVEFRAYNLVPGTRDEFHRLFVEEALPLLLEFGVEVVAYGPSLHDADSYFLVRVFADAADRERSENAFYGSAAWRDGPREAILERIESYTTIVRRVDGATLEALRKLSVGAGSPSPR